MAPLLLEWLNVAVRWAHVIAAIMWIGDSFLFMWLDRSLTKPSKPREGEVVGELWMAHSGGFYEVVKRKSLDRLPDELHWFKWESYSTWITGFLLLIIVYWLGGRAMMLDAASPLSTHAAVTLSAGSLLVATAIYHIICRSPLAANLRAMSVLGLVSVAAGSWALGLVLTPRATFLQVGAILGTIMASNVFFIIIPAQKHMLASTAAGKPVDTSYGARAKIRSTHNHYLTLPVLFTMLSNHFPSLYGHKHAWLVLSLLAVAGVGIKLFMNFRLAMPKWQLAGTVAALGASTWLTMPSANPALDEALAALPPVSFATAEAIVQARCVTCHAAEPANPAYAAPPQGVVLDSPAAIADSADRILVNAVRNHTMPLGNLTGMTADERTLLGGWIVQGARLDAPGPVQLEIRTEVAAGSFDSPQAEAKFVYTTRCAACHGDSGRGDGPAAGTLNPPPRNYRDASWQRETTDEAIAKAIVYGGAAIGKAATMPPSSDLQDKPDVVSELVKIIRAFEDSSKEANP